MKRILLASSLILFLILAGCAPTVGHSAAEKRQVVLDMKNQVLSDLYKVRPDVRAQVASAPGYAVFSNANINLVFASFGGGYGVVKNTKTGTHTFMQMGEVGVGLGLGVKDFRAVFVFHNAATMHRFIDKGWAFGAQADAAAKAGKMGAAVGGEITVDNMTIYQLTESGLALQGTIKGTRYWKDRSLN